MKRPTVKKETDPRGRGKVRGTAADVGDDPKKNVIILDDDGQFYLIKRSDWEKPENVIPSTDPSFGTLEMMSKEGTFLAGLPDDSNGGVGSWCTLVNVQSVLKA
jgi:hypothetical protein